MTATPLFQAGDQCSVFINQGYRAAMVLAVLHSRALLEYEMPEGSTALRETDATMRRRIDLTHHDRTLPYRTLPRRWIRAIVDQGTADQLLGYSQYLGSGGDRWQIDSTRLVMYITHPSQQVPA